MEELTNAHKARFTKDFGLPIQVVKEPMFTYYINLLDPFYDVSTKLQLMQDVLDADNGRDFFEESNRAKGKLVQAVKALPQYLTLQNDQLDEYKVKTGIQQQNIYNMENVGKTFVSVDLKHANFNAMRLYDPALVLGFDTYADMMGSVTEFEYFKQSKYLRQVIFGNLQPKKQQRIQKAMIAKIVGVLHVTMGIPKESFVSASSDEIVFMTDGVNDHKNYVSLINNILQKSKNTSDFFDWLRVDMFTLESIGDQKFFVKKNLITKDVSFKGIPSNLFMQVFKHYTGGEVTEYDMMFYYEGRLAKFEETVF